MEDATITRSLTILTRSSSARDQLERRSSLLSVADSSTSAALSNVSSARRDTGQRRSPMLVSRASTPPPDDDTPNQVHWINGIGDHFPTMLPSRASSLTMGSECASNASAATPDRRSETPDENNEDDLITPRVEQKPWTKISTTATPTRTISTRSCIVVQVHPLTPSPSPRRSKRGSSPPSTPRPLKRPRVQAPLEPDVFPIDQQLPEYTGGLSSHVAFQNVMSQSTQGSSGASFLATSLQSLSATDATDLLESEVSSSIPNSTPGVRRVQSLPDLVTLILPESSGTPTPAFSTRSTLSDPTQATIEIEWCSEDEIEAQLSSLLSSYRRFYLDTDVLEASEEPRGHAARARAARRTLKRIFEDRLMSAEDEGFLLQEEEEDVMNLFMTWIRDRGIPRAARTESFPDLQACLDRVSQLSIAISSADSRTISPFVRKISLLPVAQHHYSLYEIPEIEGVGFPALGPEGGIEWDFDGISCVLEHFEASDRAIGWDDLVLWE